MVYIGRERLVSSPVHRTISSIVLEFIPARHPIPANNWYLQKAEIFLHPEIVGGCVVKRVTCYKVNNCLSHHWKTTTKIHYCRPPRHNRVHPLNHVTPTFVPRTRPLPQIESKINPVGTGIGGVPDNLGSELMAHFNYEIIRKSRIVSG